MVKPLPKNHEADFNVNELFFPRTDHLGVILAGNRVFYRVSGYIAEELIGKPHNVIRHPDMPKAVFQFFWETLQAGNPIAAYVKNMAVDGSYYWVLAVAMPTSDGYISVRMKPTSNMFPIVKQLYADLLTVEKREGVKGSYPLLFERIRVLGFKNYADLARQALAAEFASRDKLRTRSNGTPMARTFEESVDKYVEIFELAAKIGKVNLDSESNIEKIQGSYSSVHYSAINMTAEAERGGQQGRVLATIATTFEKWASEVHHAMETVQESANMMNKRLDSMTLSVMIARLQCDMLLFLASEFAIDSSDVAREVGPFFKMASEVFQNALDDISQVLTVIATLDRQLELLREALNALAVIRQSSRVETARLDTDAFRKHIEGMNVFINAVGNAAAILLANDVELRDGVRDIQVRIEKIKSAINCHAP